jgi:hypothetical protein
MSLSVGYLLNVVVETKVDEILYNTKIFSTILTISSVKPLRQPQSPHQRPALP